MQIPFKLSIQGVFLDSFIYSGVLYLIHEDYTCRSYSWIDICQFIKDRNGFKNNTYDIYLEYLKENSLKLDKYIESINVEIASHELSKLEKSSFQLGFWPSDINLFSNKLYYAGDDGVYYINTNFREKSFSKPPNNKISDIKCFNISPSYLSRISLAAGTDGVHTVSHHSLNKYEKQLSSENSIDIDWGGNDLFINSCNKLNIQSFSPISFDDLEKNDEELYKILCETYKDNKHKMKDHYLIKMLSEEPNILNTSPYEYGWSSGDCDFLLNKNNTLVSLNKITGEPSFNQLNTDIKPLKIRTSGCGTIVESNNDTLGVIQKNNSLELLSDDFVSWRIYPRARSHSDHLHIINDENINILVLPPDNNSNLNSYLTDKKLIFNSDFLKKFLKV